MAQPSPGDVHVNSLLTNMSVAYIQDDSVFIANKVFPTVPVMKQSDLYFVYKKEDFLRDEARVRGPGTESAGGGYTLGTQSYMAKVWAWHKDVDDQTRANADSPINMDRDASLFVTQKLLIRREVDWCTTYFGTGIWGTDMTPAALWSSPTGNPIADVTTGKLQMQGVTGFIPNTLTIGPQVLAALKTNPAVIDRIKYTSRDSVDVNTLAPMLGVDRILVANAVATTGKEGTNTQTTGFIAGKHALLTYTPPSPSLMQPAAGYTFAWNGLLGAQAGLRMKSFRMENLESDRIEGEMAYALSQVAPGMGYFMSGVVA